mmetsp:Transcript_62/g.201  ORF Transcript_62/g.201 Transcript_62/m.201 type:complete len:101 (-) Transcript_62:603-905(-)
MPREGALHGDWLLYLRGNEGGPEGVECLGRRLRVGCVALPWLSNGAVATFKRAKAREERRETRHERGLTSGSLSRLEIADRRWRGVPPPCLPVVIGRMPA